MTRDGIIEEMRELKADLLAFQQARGVLHARLREMDNAPERQAMMTDWPAFKVIDNGFIMAVVRCEGLLEDYQKLLEQEELPDNVVRLERRP